MRSLPDDFEVVAVVDDRPRRSPSFFTFPFDSTGFRVVSEAEARTLDGIDVVFVRGSLVGCRLWGCTESDTTEAT